MAKTTYDPANKKEIAIKKISDIAFDGTKTKNECIIALTDIILEANKMLEALNK